MDLTDQDIQEFIAVWEKELGERLTPSRARLEASLLIELALALARPLPGESGYAAPLME